MGKIGERSLGGRMLEYWMEEVTKVGEKVPKNRRTPPGLEGREEEVTLTLDRRATE